MSPSEALVDFTAKSMLADLRVIEMEASIAAFGEPKGIKVRFDNSSHLVDDTDTLQLEYRVRNTTEVNGADGGLLFSTKSTWAVSIAFTDRPMSTDEAVLEEFQASVVMVAVIPYVRELVNSTAARFGFPGVLFPLMKAGDLHETNPATDSSPQDQQDLPE
jgi:hypothetical protein